MSEKEFKRNFAKTLRWRMEDLGLSRKQLAERVGVSQAAVALWVNMKTTPRAVVIPKLAEALGVSVTELLVFD